MSRYPLLQPGDPCEVCWGEVVEQRDSEGRPVYRELDVWYPAVFVQWVPTPIAPTRGRVLVEGEERTSCRIVSCAPPVAGGVVRSCSAPSHVRRVGAPRCAECVVVSVCPEEWDE